MLYLRILHLWMLHLRILRLRTLVTPEHWSAALRSAGAPERSRFAGARLERRSRKLARSAVGAPLRKRPERNWSAGAPTALQQTVKFIGSLQKFRAARSLFLLTDSYFMKNYIPTSMLVIIYIYTMLVSLLLSCLAIYYFNFTRQNMLVEG